VTRLVRRVLAAALLGVAAGPASLSAPAHAAACAGTQGVTVVVGSSVGCDSDGGGRAASNFAAAGHQLTYASRAPGFVCRVDGAPASDPCLEASPSDAYWGLFWSDGKSGAWTYASIGVSALKVPQGGSVAFVFQGSSSRTWPSVKPPVAQPEPTRATTRPTTAGGGSAPKTRPTPRTNTSERTNSSAAPRGGSASAPSAAVPGATSPSASVPTPSATPSTGPTPSTSVPTADGTDGTVAGAPAVQPTAAEAGSGTTSPAAVVAGGGVVVLLATAGGVAWYRRRAG
jgi:hypothetical protein